MVDVPSGARSSLALAKPHVRHPQRPNGIEGSRCRSRVAVPTSVESVLVAASWYVRRWAHRGGGIWIRFPVLQPALLTDHMRDVLPAAGRSDACRLWGIRAPRGGNQGELDSRLVAGDIERGTPSDFGLGPLPAVLPDRQIVLTTLRALGDLESGKLGKRGAILTG